MDGKASVFVGTWGSFMNDDGNLMSGDFELYISERKSKDDGNAEYIRGIITEELGKATFEGEISPGIIRFTKLYSKEAIEKGGHNDRIEYAGNASDSGYTGLFTVVNGHVMDGSIGNWQGTFYMWKKQETVSSS